LGGTVLFFLLLLLGANIWQFLRWQKSQPNQRVYHKSSIWRTILTQEEPVSLVLGDIFIFQEYDSLIGRTRLLRDSESNAVRNFDSLLRQHPHLVRRNPQVSDNPLLMKAHALGLSHLIPVLSTYGPGTTVRLISRMSPENLQEGPIIFVGMYKTLGVLEYVFEDSHFRLQSNKGELLHLPDSTPLTGEGNHLDYHTDLAYFANLTGPGGHPVWIIAALTDTGLTQLTQTLSEASSLRALEAKLQASLGSLPPQFEALFEVKGFDRTYLEMDLKYVYSR